MSTRSKRNIYRFEMTDDDHRALGDALRALRGMVVLSGYACGLYDDELYPDWRRVTKATVGDGAVKRTEVLWLNQAAVNNGAPLFSRANMRGAMQ